MSSYRVNILYDLTRVNMFDRLAYLASTQNPKIQAHEPFPCTSKYRRSTYWLTSSVVTHTPRIPSSLFLSRSVMIFVLSSNTVRAFFNSSSSCMLAHYTFIIPHCLSPSPVALCRCFVIFVRIDLQKMRLEEEYGVLLSSCFALMVIHT